MLPPLGQAHQRSSDLEDAVRSSCLVLSVLLLLVVPSLSFANSYSSSAVSGTAFVNPAVVFVSASGNSFNFSSDIEDGPIFLSVCYTGQLCNANFTFDMIGNQTPLSTTSGCLGSVCA